MYVQYVIILGLSGAALAQGQAQPESARDWASLVGQRFQAVRDVTYKRLPDGDLKLDLYVPYTKEPGPAILYIHGGGWQTGTKEQYVLWYLPYLQLGFRVAAVQYRLSGRAPAPAAVEDCRCALLWVGRNGERYGIDPARIVVTGGSAGGHLALMTAFLDGSFDSSCGVEGPPTKPVAVINYYGATDMTELLKTAKPHYQKFFSGPGDAMEMARRISPLNWVRPGLPPVLTLHGDADATVAHEHAVRLHEALDKAGTPNELVTIKDGAHGRHTWTDADTLLVQRRIEAFLGKHKVLSESKLAR